MGKYEYTPGDRVNGVPTYLLTDIKGRLVSRVTAVDDEGNIVNLLADQQGRLISRMTVVDDEGHIVDLLADHSGNLHITHATGLKSIMVNEPGLAYANGVNALCLAAPSTEAHRLDIVGVYLSTNAAGSFYLVTRNLGIAPGATTNYTFDLVGMMGTDITNTCDVIWGAFLANQGRGVTGGSYDMHLMAGREVYLIAPNVTYHVHVNYLETL